MVPVGLGTFPFSNVFGRVTEKEADRIVHEFLDGGGTYIQTAPYYAGVDAIMSRVLKRIPRSLYTFATLCVKDRNENIAGGRDALIAQVDDSLTVTGLDYIDLYLTSTPEGSDVPFGETVDAMSELLSQGKIKAIGVCNVTLEQLLEYNASGKVEYVQNRFSLVDQEQDRTVREYCAQNGISLVPYNVIEWGLLTGKILQPFTLREGDVRTAVLPVFSEDRVATLRDWVRTALLPLATEAGVGVEALAIHWATQQPAVEVCPVGATSVEQIRRSMAALTVPHDPSLLARIDAAYDALAVSIRERHGLSVNEYLRNSFGRW